MSQNTHEHLCHQISWHHKKSVTLTRSWFGTLFTTRPPCCPQATATLELGGAAKLIGMAQTATVWQWCETVALTLIWRQQLLNISHYNYDTETVTWSYSHDGWHSSGKNNYKICHYNYKSVIITTTPGLITTIANSQACSTHVPTHAHTHAHSLTHINTIILSSTIYI